MAARKLYSSVGKGTRLHAEETRINGSSPGKDKRLLRLQNVHTGSGAHPASYLTGKGRLFLRGGKRPEHTSAHLAQPSTEVTNEWSFIFTLPDAFMTHTKTISVRCALSFMLRRRLGAVNTHRRKLDRETDALAARLIWNK